MAVARPYVPFIPRDVAFISSKGTTYVKEAYARTDQDSRNSFEIRDEEIWRRRSLASIRSVISVLLILHSNIIPLVLDREREIYIFKLVRLWLDTSIHALIQIWFDLHFFVENYGNIEMNPICLVMILLCIFSLVFD
jgi:hypothetical protein